MRNKPVNMDIEKLYQELEQQVLIGNALYDALDYSVGLTNKHYEWGGKTETIIAIIDPNGAIYDKSSPVGMFYTGWNVATFHWIDEKIDENEQRNRNIKGFAQALGALNAIVKFRPNHREEKPPKSIVENSHDIFLIHGHDDLAKHNIARFIEKLGLNICILHEMENLGKTIIEKFEKHANVGFAIALLTKDDVVNSKQHPKSKVFRARQNVVFEMGYFIGKLGRDKVCALVEKGVELPSDINGIIYISLDTNETWKLNLIKELKGSGLNINLNKIS